MYNSVHLGCDANEKVRPIVVLESGLKVDTTDKTKNGSSFENAWIIK